MSFYVGQKEFAELSGRSKSGIIKARTTKRLPDERLEDDTPVYDMDDPQVRIFLATLPNHHGAEGKAKLRALQKKFDEDRAAGNVRCRKTGQEDLMFDPTEHVIMDDETLDRRKKQKEIEHKSKQIEKMDISILAMKGGLIPREYVNTWVQRYVGAVHTQVLEMAASGICDDFYNIAHRNKDSREAIKEMEKLLANAGSEILKGAISTMEKNAV